MDEADARVLLSLMHLRSVGSVQNGNIVAELRDPNDVELANDGAGDDFIVSQRLISLLLASPSTQPSVMCPWEPPALGRWSRRREIGA